MLPREAIRRLGHYHELTVPARLGDVLDAVWVYACPTGSDGDARPVHRVLPDTGISLCFRCVRDARGAVLEGTLLLMGPIHAPRLFEPPPGLHLEAVRLKPEWCPDLLGVAPGEHVDGMDDLAAVCPRIAPGLVDRLRLTRSTGAALAVLLEEVEARALERPLSRGTRLTHAGLERIRSKHDTTVEISRVARDLGVSERHLRRLVRDRAGSSPKRLQRIDRLNRAVARSDRAASPSWSRLAVASGFYDQSHLIAEFRALTGCTPAELHAERRAEWRSSGR